jgi:hypothetical protein
MVDNKGVSVGNGMEWNTMELLVKCPGLACSGSPEGKRIVVVVGAGIVRYTRARATEVMDGRQQDAPIRSRMEHSASWWNA